MAKLSSFIDQYQYLQYVFEHTAVQHTNKEFAQFVRSFITGKCTASFRDRNQTHTCSIGLNLKGKKQPLTDQDVKAGIQEKYITKKDGKTVEYIVFERKNTQGEKHLVHSVRQYIDVKDKKTGQQSQKPSHEFNIVVNAEDSKEKSDAKVLYKGDEKTLVPVRPTVLKPRAVQTQTQGQGTTPPGGNNNGGNNGGDKKPKKVERVNKPTKETIKKVVKKAGIVFLVVVVVAAAVVTPILLVPALMAKKPATEEPLPDTSPSYSEVREADELIGKDNPTPDITQDENGNKNVTTPEGTTPPDQNTTGQNESQFEAKPKDPQAEGGNGGTTFVDGASGGSEEETPAGNLNTGVQDSQYFESLGDGYYAVFDNQDAYDAFNAANKTATQEEGQGQDL